MKLENQSIIPADNSGPNFDFSGEISPEFVGKIFQWAREQAKQNEDPEPSNFEMSRDQSWAEVSWSGNSENTLTIQEDKGRFRIAVSGDGEEIDVPDSQFFSEGRYVDDQNEAYIVLNGDTYDLDTLAEILKKFKAQEKIKNSVAQTP
jgi:hypothetical protein